MVGADVVGFSFALVAAFGWCSPILLAASMVGLALLCCVALCRVVSCGVFRLVSFVLCVVL